MGRSGRWWGCRDEEFWRMFFFLPMRPMRWLGGPTFRIWKVSCFFSLSLHPRKLITCIPSVGQDIKITMTSKVPKTDWFRLIKNWTPDFFFNLKALDSQKIRFTSWLKLIKQISRNIFGNYRPSSVYFPGLQHFYRPSTGNSSLPAMTKSCRNLWPGAIIVLLWTCTPRIARCRVMLKFIRLEEHPANLLRQDRCILFRVNLGNYTIHGSYGI